MRRAVVGIVVMVVLVSGGCQRARLDARCRTTDFGDDGGAWVLRCQHGHWTRLMTKQQAADVILRLSQPKPPPDTPASLPGTVTTYPDPTVPTTVPTPIESPPTTTTPPTPISD